MNHRRHSFLSNSRPISRYTTGQFRSIAGLGLVLVVVFLTGCCRLDDQELLSQFEQSRRSLEELVVMFEEDRHLLALSRDSVTTVEGGVRAEGQSGEKVLSDTRWQRYLALLDQAQVEHIVRIEGGTRFLAWGCGIAPSGRLAGYDYLVEPPMNVVAELDDDFASEGLEYIHLEGNWYFFGI